MGALRVVVYTEGPAEGGTTGATELPPRPGAELREDELGASHHLVRRSIDAVSGRPADSVRFDAPLRHRGREVRGSQLLDEGILRRLLTWADPNRSPDLAVVCIDADGQRHRRSYIEDVLDDLPGGLQRLVAMSIQEFDAWLIADVSAVNDVLGEDFGEVKAPESMEPGEAKRRFEAWVLDESESTDISTARRRIAQFLNLQRVADRCDAFERFISDLESDLEELDRS